MDPQQANNPAQASSPPTAAPPPTPKSKRNSYDANQRAALLQAFRTRTCTVAQFCAKHKVSYTTLNAWLTKPKAVPKRSKRAIKAAQSKRYTPEQRRQAVEAFEKAGIKAEDFARTWGISESILRRWSRQYREAGGKGLERKVGRPRGRKPVHPAVAREIISVKQRFPAFGLRSVGSFLARFKGLKATPSVVRQVVKEAGLPSTPLARLRWKKKPKIRHFERAKPGQLWQSDITSFNLARSGQRVHLVVFIDDNSRYVVSWKLAMKATTQFVEECLLDGIQRFGKPVEVLTDQGPQYFSWRGKSDFQKLLERQGIKHVVARTHHPQTVGKCERFWETVGNEFWSRVQPQELLDAQQRFGHFVHHYNHFRPHQGIEGSVPADRLFGAEDQVRQAIEKVLSANELALALDEPTRQPVFLVGQIGEHSVTLHGERGKLVLSTQEGLLSAVAFEDIGMAGKAREVSDERRNCGADNRHDPAEAAGPQAGGAQPEEASLQDAQAADSGESVVGQRQPGGKGEGAPDRGGADGILDGPHHAPAAGREDEHAAGEGLAALEAGLGGPGGRPAQAAQEGAGGGGAAAGRPQATEETDRGPEATERDARQPGGGAEDLPGAARTGEEAGTEGGRQDGQAGPPEGEKNQAQLNA